MSRRKQKKRKSQSENGKIRQYYLQYIGKISTINSKLLWWLWSDYLNVNLLERKFDQLEKWFKSQAEMDQVYIIDDNKVDQIIKLKSAFSRIQSNHIYGREIPIVHIEGAELKELSMEANKYGNKGKCVKSFHIFVI